MEVSIIMLSALSIGVGVAALKSLAKHKRNSKEDIKYKNL